MRSLTKSGIRELNAKYRSILKKCAILNAMVLMLGSSSAMAADLPSIIQDETVSSYTLNGDETMTKSLGTLAGDNREFTINGNGYALKGADAYEGITFKSGQKLKLNNISMQNFYKFGKGSAIENGGTVTEITGNFKGNTANNNGGAIYNQGQIDEITSLFENNTAAECGGSIDNAGTITSIKGDFKYNMARTLQGGAIHNSSIIGSVTNSSGGIEGDFEYNTAMNGGAVSNDGTITNIIGNFTNNSAKNIGGAINNTGTITKVTGNFTNNYANSYGGAVFNHTNHVINFVAEGRNITFDGNYVASETGKGGAIRNFDYGTVGLYADVGHSITFLGDKTTQILPDDAKDIDGVYNTGTLNINGYVPLGESTPVTYTGTVNLYNVSDYSTPFSTPSGTTNIYGGVVRFGGNYTQKVTNIHGGTLNFANNKINTANLGTLSVVGNANLILDADLAKGKMDQLNVTSLGDVTGQFKITDIRILSDGVPANPLTLFTAERPTNVTGNLTNLSGPVFIYNADYADGQITFTKTGVHPYLYAPSTMAQTTASMTGQIAGLVMNQLDASAGSEKGLSAGDMAKASNAWVKVMGFDDDVDFKHFNSVDSKAYTLAAGFNTDKVRFDNFDAAFGAYAGYIGGRQKYTGNKIEQNGGYVGLSSELTQGNAFLLSTINGGFINNESENMYGTDKFDTRWFGLGLKGGYNYALTNSVVFQPNIYAGYTLVNTEDYTSKSGVRIKNDNLNFFEIDPGFKLMTQIDKNWLGFIQGKYAIVMDNGGETTVNEYVLPNISTKNYFEYGIGMNKSLTDVWSLNGEINRRDGGRTGWNGSLEFKYHF